MCYKTLITLSVLCISLAWGLSPVQATVIPLVDGNGDDSGWTVTSGGAALDLLASNIIDVDLNAKTATITVIKDFGPPEDILGTIILAVGSLTFAEVDVNGDKIDKIIIHSETIDNNTGLVWDAFSWHLQPTGAAEFNTIESSGWTEASFSTWVFETDNKLVASNGSVANGATFSPASNLVIDIKLDSSDAAVAFTLKQHTTPEPATMAVLVVGGLVVLSRRFRKR